MAKTFDQFKKENIGYTNFQQQKDDVFLVFENEEAYYMNIITKMFFSNLADSSAFEVKVYVKIFVRFCL